MAKCPACGQEMLTADGCLCQTIRVNGIVYRRIKVGDPGDFFEGEKPGFRCGDCDALVGHYHHWGCDCERCPSCGEQLITCDCEDIEIENAP